MVEGCSRLRIVEETVTAVEADGSVSHVRVHVQVDLWNCFRTAHSEEDWSSSKQLAFVLIGIS